jgi:hypothetical protein
MENFESFGKPPIMNYNKMNSKVPLTFRDYHDSDYDSEEEEDKRAIATIKKENAAGHQAFVNDQTGIDKGLAQINARHGVPGYDPMSPTGYTKGGRRRKRPTRRSRKTKSKRRKTRRRRRR